MQPVNTKAIAKKQSEVKRLGNNYLKAVGELPLPAEAKDAMVQLLSGQETYLRQIITEAGLVAAVPVAPVATAEKDAAPLPELGF